MLKSYSLNKTGGTIMFNKIKVIMLFLLISSFSFAKISISGFLKEKINTAISKDETVQSTNEKLDIEDEEEKLEGEQLVYEDGKLKYKFYYQQTVVVAIKRYKVTPLSPFLKLLSIAF